MLLLLLLLHSIRTRSHGSNRQEELVPRIQFASCARTSSSIGVGVIRAVWKVFLSPLHCRWQSLCSAEH